VVIGISVDKLEDQDKFTRDRELNFPLMADPDKKATEAFGALGTSGRANRYTYVIDKKGVVRQVYTKVSTTEHPKEVLDYVKDNLK
jgi:peroxiredoxin Q/BCP